MMPGKTTVGAWETIRKALEAHRAGVTVTSVPVCGWTWIDEPGDVSVVDPRLPLPLRRPVPWTTRLALLGVA